MKYLMLVCFESDPKDDEAAVMQRETPTWVSEMDGRGVRLFGQVLESTDTAVTVRVREGETLLSDGPFIESKEFIAGFDLIDCAGPEEAIEIASKHPVAQFQSIEVRPFMMIPDTPEPEVPQRRLADGPPPGRERHLLLMCPGSGPTSALDAATTLRHGLEWLSEARRRGVEVYSHALEHADLATTVRVRKGEALLSDGPFVETKEFLGGFSIIDCQNRGEAIRWAASHPLSQRGAIEVRPVAALF